jgi:hypothetical protein
MIFNKERMDNAKKKEVIFNKRTWTVQRGRK